MNYNVKMFYNNKLDRDFYRVLIYCNYFKNLRNLYRIPNHDSVFEIYLFNLNKVNFSLLLEKRTYIIYFISLFEAFIALKLTPKLFLFVCFKIITSKFFIR